MSLLGFGADVSELVAGTDPGVAGTKLWLLSAPSARVGFVPVPFADQQP